MAEQKQQPDLNKQIENHIKDLLFNNKSAPTEPPPPQNNPDINYDIGPYGLFGEKPFAPANKNIPLKNDTLSLDCSLNSQPTSANSSQLIDLNVLTNFAAKHAVIDDIISSTPTVPHPELEDSSFTSPSTNPPFDDVLLNYTEGSKNPPGYPGFQDVSKTGNQNTVKPEGSKDNAERGASDKKRKNRQKQKKSKQNAKEKASNKAFNKSTEKPVNKPGASSPKKEFPKFNKANKNSPMQKEAPKSPEKRNQRARSESVVNQSERVPPPTEEDEYIMHYTTEEGYKFSCIICNYDAKSSDFIRRHLNSENHKEIKEQIKANRLLHFLPKPLPHQIEAIDSLLLQCHNDHGLLEEDLLTRQRIAERLIKFVKDHLTDCSIDMIGSSFTGLGLRYSKVDFSLKVANEKDIPDSLELLHNKLLTDSAYCDVECEFKQKRLRISFIDKETALDCSIDVECVVSEKFAKLFSIYAQLDPRVRILASCFRYWANMCYLDDMDRGTLPPFTFSILLVYFLQQINPPVLPVLHEFKEYGFSPEFPEKYLKSNTWKSENTSSVGELWLQLFYFYNFTYTMGKHVVSIRSSEKVLCSEKKWATKFYAIEDPFTRRNIAHVIPNYQVCLFIQRCFMQTYRYFAFPQIKDGKIDIQQGEEFGQHLQAYVLAKSDANDSSDEWAGSDNEDSSIPDESGFMQDLEDLDPDLQIEDVVEVIKQMTLDESKAAVDGEASEDSSDVVNAQSSESPKKDSESLKAELKKTKEKEKEAKAEEERLKVLATCSWDVQDDIPVEAFCYKFKPEVFKGKKHLPVLCKNCKTSGHLKKDCPNDRLPCPIILPPMSDEFLKLINKALHYIKDKHCIDNRDRDFMLNTMRDIEAYIQKLFPKANLSMFGSFCNGFGFKSRSDMDFCLTFRGQDDGKDLDSTEVIESLAKHLKEYPRLENIVPVTSAKVPIVKFACKETGLEGDISLYNTLAIANTEMLEIYSRIDKRVQILGFALKYFAKVLGICDASRGSLSSYAYILMVIFFLQQRNPPVIPVLQELHGEEKPSVVVDGCNVWYFKDIDKLPEVWPEYGKNKEIPAQLWLGLLNFYAYDFDWQEYVVSIRQKAPLTRFRKMWMTEQIAIEDPFDLNHNLGAGLSRKMNMYIIKTFIRGRERFGTPLPKDDILQMQGHDVTYFFDRRFLNSGAEPPHDRGCRKCGKIGHIAKNCPGENLCRYCKKPGHLQKGCPKRKERLKAKQSDRNAKEPFPKYETKNNFEAHSVQNQSLRPQGGDIQRTNNPILSLFSNSTEDRKLLQRGLPAHRHPPPGFAFERKSFPMGPPPGFKAMHQNSINLPRFPTSSPFPRTPPMKILPGSPPKHYSCSPPKTYMGGSMYHHPEPIPPMGVRSDLRVPPPEIPRIWQQNSMPKRFPTFGDRRKRTN